MCVIQTITHYSRRIVRRFIAHGLNAPPSNVVVKHTTN